MSKRLNFGWILTYQGRDCLDLFGINCVQLRVLTLIVFCGLNIIKYQHIIIFNSFQRVEINVQLLPTVMCRTNSITDGILVWFFVSFSNGISVCLLKLRWLRNSESLSYRLNRGFLFALQVVLRISIWIFSWKLDWDFRT